MPKPKKPSEQVNAAYEMGRLEGRVKVADKTLKPSDFTQYLKNCEDAEMIAERNVIDFISELSDGWANNRLKKTFENYKSKYWKQ